MEPEYNLIDGVKAYINRDKSDWKVKITTFFKNFSVMLDGTEKYVYRKLISRYYYQKANNKLLNGKPVNSMDFQEYVFEQIPEDMKEDTKLAFERYVFNKANLKEFLLAYMESDSGR